MYEILVPILIGTFAGFLTGITGVGSTGFILAGLSFSHIIKDYKMVVGTALYTLLFPTAALAAFEFYKNKKINFLVGNLLLVSILLGAYLGSKLVFTTGFSLSEKNTKYITSLIGFFTCIYFFYEASKMK